MRPQNAGTLRTLGGCQGRRWGTFDGVGREEHTAGARLLVSDPFRRQEPRGCCQASSKGLPHQRPPPSLQGALPGWGWSGGTLRLSAQLNRNAFLERGQHHTVPRAFFWVSAAAFSTFLSPFSGQEPALGVLDAGLPAPSTGHLPCPMGAPLCGCCTGGVPRGELEAPQMTARRCGSVSAPGRKSWGGDAKGWVEVPGFLGVIDPGSGGFSPPIPSSG